MARIHCLWWQRFVLKGFIVARLIPLPLSLCIVYIITCKSHVIHYSIVSVLILDAALHNLYCE